MTLVERQAKGLAACLVEAGLDPERLHIHISEIAPGTRAHPPHTHDAIEALYIIAGHGAVEAGGERRAVGPNEAVILDARGTHGLENTGSTTLRYMVIIARA